MKGELSRRSFVELSGSMVLLGGAGVQPQLDTDRADEEYEVYGLVLEPRRPSKAVLDEQWDDYRIVQLNPQTGEKAYTTHLLSGWKEIPMPNPTTQVDELRVEDYKSLFNHTFARPNAPDTKNWNFTPADVTQVDTEIELASTTSMETTHYGNYPPGTESIPGVAFRVTDTPSAGEGFAGYFDAGNGFGGGEDTTDSYVFIRKDGATEKVYRSDWNGHVPDSRVWVNDSPVITRMPHLFYGGGNIKIRALLHENGESALKTLHTFTPKNVPSSFGNGPPFDEPNLPVRFESSSLSGGALRANAAHYEYGESDAENRINGEHFTGINVPTTDWVPLLSWRKRTGWEHVNVKPLLINTFARNNDLKLEIQLGTTLGSPTWNLPTHTSSSETAVEFAIGGSISSDGERRWTGYAAAGQGNATGQGQTTDLDFNLPTNRVVTLAAQAVGNSATAKGNVTLEELF